MALLVYLITGAFAGFTAGLLGVGGGVIMVPVFIALFTYQGFPQSLLTHCALATSLACMIVSASSSTLAHQKKLGVNWVAFKNMGVGVLLGSFLGVMVAVKLTGVVLQLSLATFLILVGIKMFSGWKVASLRPLPGRIGQTLSGTVIAAMSMLFGIGGGSMTVPFLTWCSFSPQLAVGTSAALGLPIASFGSLLYVVNGWGLDGLPEYSAGYVYLPAVIGTTLASVPAARLGANMAHALPAAKLRKVFAAFIIIISLVIFLRNIPGLWS